MDQSWTNSTANFTMRARATPGSAEKPCVWADSENATLYRWGGDYAGEADTAALWEFKDPSFFGDQLWSSVLSADDDELKDIVSTKRGASAQCGRKGYWISGSGSSHTDPRFESENEIPVPGILTFDLDTLKWSNDSTTPLTSQPGGAILGARAACAATRDDTPLVVLLGGEETSARSIEDVEYRGMDNITFWDPESGRWYSQEARGPSHLTERSFAP